VNLSFLCICEYVYLECHYWSVCSYVAVGPTNWFVAIEATLDWPIGLSPLRQHWTDRLVCRHWGNVGLTDWFVTIELTNRFVAGGLMLDWSIGLSLDWWLMSPVDQRSDRRRTVGSRPTAMCYLGTNYKFEGFLFNQEIQLKSWQWSCKFFTFFCFHVIICCTSVKKCWIYKFPN